MNIGFLPTPALAAIALLLWFAAMARYWMVMPKILRPTVAVGAVVGLGFGSAQGFSRGDSGRHLMVILATVSVSLLLGTLGRTQDFSEVTAGRGKKAAGEERATRRIALQTFVPLIVLVALADLAVKSH